jgi:uncharacterized protein (DUF58 family)
MTRNGAVLAVVTAGLVFAGVWMDYPELVTLGYSGLSALVIALAWLVARPRLVTGREVHPRRVFEGSAARAVLTVTNVGRRRSPPLLATEAVGRRRIAVRIPPLDGGVSCTVDYPLPTAKRGRYLVPPLALGHSDPLRLLHRSRTYGGELTVHVYPRIHPLAIIATGGPQDAEGPTASSAPPGGVAFHSLREYLPGDDWRLIHWGATARTSTIMARHLVVPDEPRQLVLLDTSAAPYSPPLFEDAVRVAASFCATAEQARIPTRLRTTGGAEAGAPASGSQWSSDLTTSLGFLSTVDSESADPGLAALPNRIRDVVAASQGVALVVVTGRLDAARVELLTLLRPRFLSVSLAQLLPRGTAAARPRGVRAVAATSSAQFATSWNRLVLR